ncbi:MAG TPA: sigma-54 dependent transcriptional regulator [Polyangiales bacterium]
MTTHERILLVEDDDDMRASLRQVLENAGHSVLEASSARDAEPLLVSEVVDLVITDLRMPNGGGEEVLKHVKAITPGTPVLVVTAYPSVESAIESFRGGVADYLLKPFTDTQLIESVDRALAARRAGDRAALLRHIGASAPDMPNMIGASRAFAAMLTSIRRFAPLEGAVLIHGETGSGKELVARTIHALSRRTGGQFVVVNCAAIPENLIESELFGHEKGAFTGAISTKQGLFEAANEGSLFLDEVAELSPAAQAKLLRCLEERAVRRVGALRPRPADVRIIAASHKELGALVGEGKFREDLLYRLAVLEVRVPPLRERPQDIPTLAVHFLDRLRTEAGREIVGFDEEAMTKLVQHSWPGNVRELQNVVQKGFANAAPPMIGGADIHFRTTGTTATPSTASSSELTSAVDTFEYSHVVDALKLHAGNITHTAKTLGIHRTTLQRLIKRLGIPANDAH